MKTRQGLNLQAGHSEGGQAVAARSLLAGDVHVWCVALDVDAAVQSRLRSLLSTDEQTRADRFHFAQHRRRFVARRAAVRIVIASYLEMDPVAVRFSYGPRGKPAISSESAHTPLTFSASHSDELAVIAVRGSGQVGVDVERLDRVIDATAIAERFFHRHELAELRGVGRSQLHQSFLRCWVRKEAYIKARGDGLFIALDRFAISTLPAPPGTARRVMDEADESAAWFVRDLEPQSGYIAAIAAEGASWQVSQRQLSLNELDER